MSDKNKNSRRKETTTNKEERLWTPMFIIAISCALCAFLTGHGMSAGYAVFSEVMGGSSTMVGIAGTAYFLCAALTRPIAGLSIDKQGRRFTLMIGGALLVIGTAAPLLYYTETIYIFWRVLSGAGFSFVSSAASTAAADVLPESRLGEGISYFGLGQAISMGISPMIAIALAFSDPATNLFLGCTVFAIATFICGYACRYEKNPSMLPQTSVYRMRWEAGEVGRKEAGNQEPAPDTEALTQMKREERQDDARPAWKRVLGNLFEIKALPFAITIGFMGTAYGFSVNFMGLYGTTLNVETPGLYYTFVSLSMIAVRLTSGRFMDNTKPIILMGLAAATGVITYLMMLICFNLQDIMDIDWIYYLAGIPFGITMGMGMPVNQSLAVKMSPPEHWGAATALYQLGIDVAIGTSCPLWGFLGEYFNFSIALYCVIFFLVVSFISAYIVYPKDVVKEAFKTK